MAHTALEKFPDFRDDDLPTLAVIAVAEPTLEKARVRPRTYLEARKIRDSRISGEYEPCVAPESGSPVKPAGAYADVRRSSIYPRLWASVEAIILVVSAGWRLNVQLRHGNQETIGGTFEFDNYPDACLRLGAWVWFAATWIGDSWERDAGNHCRPSALIEELNLRSLSGSVRSRRSVRLPAEEEQTDRQVVERLLRLMIGEETIEDDEDREPPVDGARAIRI